AQALHNAPWRRGPGGRTRRREEAARAVPSGARDRPERPWLPPELRPPEIDRESARVVRELRPPGASVRLHPPDGRGRAQGGLRPRRAERELHPSPAGGRPRRAVRRAPET